MKVLFGSPGEDVLWLDFRITGTRNRRHDELPLTHIAQAVYYGITSCEGVGYSIVYPPYVHFEVVIPQSINSPQNPLGEPQAAICLTQG